MNSLEIIKQELINQKTLLEQKGFPVATQNTHPSPSEITSAIENIEADFTLADAKVDDVALGKTFFAETGELKTGTLDVEHTKLMSDYAYALLTGLGRFEITFPLDVSEIRDYAFYSQGIDCYYYHNMTVPAHITTLGYHAFSRCKGLTGKLIVPNTCSLNSYAFCYCINLTEAYLDCQFVDPSSYQLSYCDNLSKVTLGPNITSLPTSLFYECPLLSELEIPENVTTIGNYIIRNTAITYLIIRCKTPPAINSYSFITPDKPYVVVPYESYMDYYNATNYLKNVTLLLAYGEFSEGEALPTLLETGVTATWYATREDCVTEESPYSVCPVSGRMFARINIEST